jgi:spermidine/putrescine transport system substrate-binding protein
MCSIIRSIRGNLITSLLLAWWVTLAACTSSGPDNARSEKIVNLAVWSNFISQQALEGFRSKTGIRVQVTNYSSNEELLAKLQAGATGFDVAVPSDYMVFALVQLGLLEKLDPVKTSNRSLIDPTYLNQAYDPGNAHSLPFDWGSTGIAVHRDRYRGEIQSWKQLFESPELVGKFTLLDDSREVLGAVLKSMGKSLNSTSEAEILLARDALKKIKGRVKSFTSEPLAALKEGEIAAAQIYSSDALQARRDTGGKIEYIIPAEGATLWVDNLVIPKGAPHLEAAHALIQYLLEAKVDEERVHAILVGSVHRDALKRAAPELKVIQALYPSDQIKARLEVMKDLGEAMGLYDRAWTEVKAQ